MCRMLPYTRYPVFVFSSKSVDTEEEDSLGEKQDLSHLDTSLMNQTIMHERPDIRLFLLVCSSARQPEWGSLTHKSIPDSVLIISARGVIAES